MRDFPLYGLTLVDFKNIDNLKSIELFSRSLIVDLIIN